MCPGDPRGVGTGCQLLIATSSVAAVVLVKGIIAIATVVMPGAIATISLGLERHRAFARWIGGNESCGQAGAQYAAIVAVAGWFADSWRRKPV